MPSATGATVSLCMIVRNEERNLADCLDPIATLFDEIIIVDTGSTDGTREIALRFADEVHDFIWCDDFAAARNESMRKAHGDWIFWLDADDRIPLSQLKLLKRLIKGLGTAKVAYQMTTVCRLQFECDGVQHLSHTRLFRRDPSIYWRGRVHEQLRPSLRELGFELCHHPMRIEHLGYADASLKLKKAQRDIRLLRMDYATDPEDAGTILHLAMAYGRVSNFSEGRRYLEMLEAREMSGAEWECRLYDLLVDFCMKSGDLQAALDYSGRGLRLFPNQIALMYARAWVLFEVDAYDACASLLLRIIRLPSSQTYQGGSRGDIRSRWAPILLADTWQHLGQHKNAINLLTRALQLHPDDVRMIYSLGLNFMALGQRQRVASLRQRLEPLPQGNVFSILLLIRDRLIHDELAGLDEWIERLIQLAPQMPYARILRVDYLRRTNASLHDYLAACRDALRHCPHHRGILEQVSKIEAFLADANATKLDLARIE